MASFAVTDETPLNPEGAIRLTVDPEPANRWPNHLQLMPGPGQFFREIKDFEELAQEAAI